MALAGCGGGGGASAAPEITRLAPYIGSWSEGCDNHDLATVVIARTSADTINFTATHQFYSNANCTGTVVGTETNTAKVTMAYTGAADTSIDYGQGSRAEAAKIDVVTARRSQGVATVTGPGVVRTVKNGQEQGCMSFADGDEICLMHDGVIPADGPLSFGLYASGNNMYILSGNSSVSVVNQRLTKN